MQCYCCRRNFINFARNIACLKCDHRQPKASNSSEASAQSGHKIQGFSHFYGKGSSFVRDEDETSDEPHIRQEIPTRRWRFLEDESKDIDGSNSRDRGSRFVDFPIAGGKSELSQNSDVRLKWKAEMLKRSRHDATESIYTSASVRRRPEFVECSSSDDEEMGEWFGHGRRTQMEE